jgi:hypothetical protein
MTITLPANQAMRLLLRGEAPDHLVVEGDLPFYTTARLQSLPRGLHVRGALSLTRCGGVVALPPDLRVDGNLKLSECANLQTLGAGLRVGKSLAIKNCPQLAALPSDVVVHGKKAQIVNCQALQTWGAGWRINQELTVRECPQLAALPAGIMTEIIRVLECGITTLPPDLRANDVSIDTCAAFTGLSRLEGAVSLSVNNGPRFTQLPDGMTLDRLTISDCAALVSLPPALTVHETLSLDNCNALVTVPPLHTRGLRLQQCAALTALPDPLHLDNHLIVIECAALAALPTQLTTQHLGLNDCPLITALPAGLVLDTLDVQGCRNLTALPADLQVHGWFDIGLTPIRHLPPQLDAVELRWCGVQMDERQDVLQPENISVRKIMTTLNIERRRVLLMLVGAERFMREAGAKVQHQDVEPSGQQRQLLRVDLLPLRDRWGYNVDDEPIVMLSVTCPSTARQYMLRVPPDMQTCHQAAAWIAGFDDPDQYQPIMET